MTGIMIVFIITAGIVALALGPGYLKSRERDGVRDLVRQSIENGQPLPPEAIASITASTPRPPLPTGTRDLRRGVILLALSGGIYATAWLLGQYVDSDLFGGAAFAAIPGFIGLAFVILSFFNKTKG